jgi:hypothetical protein
MSKAATGIWRSKITKGNYWWGKTEKKKGNKNRVGLLAY